MTPETTRLVDFWNVEMDPAHRVHPADRAIMDRYERKIRRGAPVDPEEEDDFFRSGRILTGLPPQPFVGDLDGAEVFVCFLNPGVGPGDFDAQRRNAFGGRTEANFRQDMADLGAYPFYYLDPDVGPNGATDYWERKLRPIMNLIEDRMARDDGRRRVEHGHAARREIARKLALFELCPYASRMGGSIAGLMDPRLPSSEAAATFLRAKLHAGRRVVIARGRRYWNFGDASTTERLSVFDQYQAMGASLNPALPQNLPISRTFDPR